MIKIVSPTRRYLLALLAVVALLGAACGDDSSGGDSASYCDVAARQQAVDDAFDFLSSSPEELERYFRSNRNALASVIGNAPSEIKADLEATLRAFDDRFLPALQAADWNIFAASPELEALNDDATLEAMSDRIDAYDADVCGITDAADDAPDAGGDGPDTGDDGPDVPGSDLGLSADVLEGMLSTDIGRQAFIQGFTADGRITVAQAECLIDNLDFALLATLSSGAVDGSAGVGVLEAFDACGVSLDQIN